ncbi:MAG: helix-turn-helix transcriptional regulator [Pseudomonadales bacterium]|nr:helix-turn-helix transcriptional regulator [Pseudomonadales bacterium]
MTEFSISPAFNALIKAVYHGPLEEQPWQAFLRLFRDALNADFATLLLRPPKEGDSGIVLNASVISPEVYAAYNENYFELDAFVNLPASKVVTLHEFIGDVDFESSEYYQQYMRPIGLYYILGVDLTDASGMNVRVRVTRSKALGDFSAAEKNICELMVPHLLQAIELNSHLQHSETERVVLESAIDQMAMGRILLDEKLELIKINQAAQEVLQDKNDISISNNQLQLQEVLQQKAFKQLLQQVLHAYNNNEPGFVKAFKVQCKQGNNLGLLLRPMPQSISSEGHQKPAVAIFLSDPNKRRGAPLHILHQLFEFTPAESRLALLLANGLTLDEASDELAVSRNTVKSHLSAIYSKTGVTRQGKLVQLILKSVAPMG